MRALCLVPDANSPGKKDVTGAFHPEAVAFCKHHGIDPAEAIVRFPTKQSLTGRRAIASRHLTGAVGLDVLAFFCHGWRDGIQAGWRIATVRSLASLCAAALVPTGHVLLYACSTADGPLEGPPSDIAEDGPGGDGGFADELRDACETLGRRITVTGHQNEGHCTHNPYVRTFAPSCMGRGGRWVVAPGSPLWPRWVRAMKDPRGTLRYRFWAMTAEEIRAELEPTRGPLVA